MTIPPPGCVVSAVAGYGPDRKAYFVMIRASLSIAGNPHLSPLHGGGPWRIGRNPELEVPINNDPVCSRLQAEISRAEAAAC